MIVQNNANLCFIPTKTKYRLHRRITFEIAPSLNIYAINDLFINPSCKTLGVNRLFAHISNSLTSIPFIYFHSELLHELIIFTIFSVQINISDMFGFQIVDAFPHILVWARTYIWALLEPNIIRNVHFFLWRFFRMTFEVARNILLLILCHHHQHHHRSNAVTLSVVAI